MFEYDILIELDMFLNLMDSSQNIADTALLLCRADYWYVHTFILISWDIHEDALISIRGPTYDIHELTYNLPKRTFQ